MEKLIIFGMLSVVAISFSWRNLFDPKSHGFYRLFSWICIIWLFSCNYTFWFDDPFSVKQIISWVFLMFSVYLVIAGVALMLKIGKPTKTRQDNTLFQFEKTSELVETGLYMYIRHPIYSSLIYLTWGIFLKNTGFENLVITLLSTVFLYITAKYDEKECLKYFGDNYKNYMKRSKMFIPFLF